MLIVRPSSVLNVHSIMRRSVTSWRSYSKDYDSSSDDEKKAEKKEKRKTPMSVQQLVASAGTKSTAADIGKSDAGAENPPLTDTQDSEETAASRLNRLLASMQTEDQYSFAKKISLPKPGEANKKLKQKAKQEADNKDVFKAAKRVAELLGGEDKKRTESELLSKLLGRDQEAAADEGEGNEKPKTQQDENELSLSELIVKMKVDRSRQPQEGTRADYVRQMLAVKTKRKQTSGSYRDRNARSAGMQGVKLEPESYTGSVDLFGSEQLGIFKDVTQFKADADILPTWAHLQQRELQLQVTHPPANYFEKLIQWTEQGKVWRFPIDNEQDMSPEVVNEDFSEHIFLEQHLEGWCPTKGPIRHFMELVCVGLSKNPYITAKEKREHIMWYRDYFEAKKDVLKDLMSQEKLDKITTGDQQQSTTS